METASRFLAPGVVFLLTLASGFWLSNTPKPLNPILFNIHKLVALGTVVFTGVRLFSLLKTSSVQAILILLLLLAGLAVVALFATGALMSIGKLNYKALLTIHNIASVLLPAALVASVYFLVVLK